MLTRAASVGPVSGFGARHGLCSYAVPIYIKHSKSLLAGRGMINYIVVVNSTFDSSKIINTLDKHNNNNIITIKIVEV